MAQTLICNLVLWLPPGPRVTLLWCVSSKGGGSARARGKGLLRVFVTKCCHGHKNELRRAC
eukprot:3603446-Amphidinium_carterae.1